MISYRHLLYETLCGKRAFPFFHMKNFIKLRSFLDSLTLKNSITCGHFTIENHIEI